MPAGLINRSARRSHELKSAKVHPVEKPDKPAAPPRPLAHTSSELFTTNREYFRGGSRLRSGRRLQWTLLWPGAPRCHGGWDLRSARSCSVRSKSWAADPPQPGGPPSHNVLQSAGDVALVIERPVHRRVEPAAVVLGRVLAPQPHKGNRVRPMVRPEDGVKELRRLEAVGARAIRLPVRHTCWCRDCGDPVSGYPAGDTGTDRFAVGAGGLAGTRTCPSDRHQGAVAVVDLQVVGPVAVVLQLVELVEAVVGPDVVAGADLPPCAPTTLGRQMGVRNGLFTGLWRAWQVGSLVRGRRPNAIQISEFSLPSRARPVELFAEFLQCRPLHRLLHDKERRPLSRSRRCRSAPARSAGPPDRTSDGRGGHARRFAALRSLSAAGCVRYRALEAPRPSSAGPRR